MKQSPIKAIWESRANGYVYCRLNSGRLMTLHRYIWQHYYGKIPKGCEIHHLDLNPLNNTINNLVLATVESHREMHNTLDIFREVLGMSKPLKVVKILCSNWR